MDYRLRVTDLLGQTLTVSSGTLLPGDLTLHFPCSDWAAGIYWVVLESENRISARMIARP
jgi:hypothetical protein